MLPCWPQKCHHKSQAWPEGIAGKANTAWHSPCAEVAPAGTVPSAHSLCSISLIALSHSWLLCEHNAVPWLSCADDESPGLYGFLNVIVHSATGFKQSSSELQLCHTQVPTGAR